jgi:hypothetical protein
MTSQEKTKYRRSKKWKDFRKHLLENSEYTCQICGSVKKGKQSKRLHIHHTNEDAYGEEDDKDVVVICAADHELIERLLRRKHLDIDEFCANLKKVYEDSKY